LLAANGPFATSKMKLEVSSSIVHVLSHKDSHKSMEFYFADETFALICKLSSVQSILTVAAQGDWEIKQLDVKSTYLYSKLSNDKIIYMKPPPYYTSKDIHPGQVLRLNSTIYGLKQSGCHWHEVLQAILESF
jgi:hypothetical protein